jgi:CRISPR type IV-associated protein Csf3
MIPLEIMVKLNGPIILSNTPLALDSLLAYWVAVLNELPQAHGLEEVIDIEIPVIKSKCKRFHLCSHSISNVDFVCNKYINRSIVIDKCQMLGKNISRVQVNGGPSKGHRMSVESFYMKRELMIWWCIGDKREIEMLLKHVRYLGKRRGTGHGKVDWWSINRCDPWNDGFPVVRNGRPLRPLPYDWPGLVDPFITYGTLTYPYWMYERNEKIACPELSL